MLTRHRAANSVMWETYEIVCLTYEVDRLEAIEDDLRETPFYRSLQARLAEVEAGQYAVEVQMRQHMVKVAEAELEPSSNLPRTFPEPASNLPRTCLEPSSNLPGSVSEPRCGVCTGGGGRARRRRGG